MAHANYGVVDIEIGDDKYTLIPSLRAMDRLNDGWNNGLRGALAKAEDLNARDLARIVAIGADLKDPDIDALAEAVFDFGAMKVGPPVVAFVLSLLNPRATKVEADSSGEKKPRKTS